MVAFGGISTALSVLFQSAPLWLPVAGHALSPLATFPVAAAAFLSPACGVLSFLCISGILLFVSVHETLIFILSTGLLGIALGLLRKTSFALRTCIAGTALFGGMNILFFVLGVNLFGPLTQSLSGFIGVFFFIFSMLYAGFWSGVLQLVMRRAARRMRFEI